MGRLGDMDLTHAQSVSVACSLDGVRSRMVSLRKARMSLNVVRASPLTPDVVIVTVLKFPCLKNRRYHLACKHVGQLVNYNTSKTSTSTTRVATC